MRAIWVLSLGVLVCWGSAVKAELPRTIELSLPTGPHPPGDAPDVGLSFDPELPQRAKVHLVIFLHGFDGCVRALLAHDAVPCRRGEPPHRPFALGSLHAAAHTPSVLVVPQLAFHARSSKGHRFARHGSFDVLVDAVASDARAPLGGSRARIASIKLVAHSAGYDAAAQILDDPTRKTPIDHVVLLDALYARRDSFARWVAEKPSHVLISLHTAQPQTLRQNELLARDLAALSPARDATDLARALADERVVIASVKTRHGDMPEAHLAPALRALFSRAGQTTHATAH